MRFAFDMIFEGLKINAASIHILFDIWTMSAKKLNFNLDRKMNECMNEGVFG